MAACIASAALTQHPHQGVRTVLDLLQPPSASGLAAAAHTHSTAALHVSAAAVKPPVLAAIKIIARGKDRPDMADLTPSGLLPYHDFIKKACSVA